MAGAASGSITGHTAAGITYTISFTFAAADAPSAQTTLNGIKTFLSGASTIDSVQVNFTPQSTALS